MTLIAPTVGRPADTAAVRLPATDMTHSEALDPSVDKGTPSRAEFRMTRIACRAHELYVARDGRNGTALEDWLTAERQIDDEIDRARESTNRRLSS